MRIRLVFTALLAVAALGSTAAPAEAVPVGRPLTKCGQSITGPVYLVRDLTCKAGFVVPHTNDDWHNASVDLRGHRLRGPGGGTAFSVGGEEPYADTLEVKNGRIDHWGTGFEAVFASVKLTKIRLDHNRLGMYCSFSLCDVTDTVVEANQNGATAFADGALRFTRTAFIANDVGSHSNRSSYTHEDYVDSSFVDNKVGVMITPKSGATIRGSVFIGNGVGIKAEDPQHGGIYTVSIEGNRFYANGDGVNLTEADDINNQAVIADNVVTGNRRYGIYAVPKPTDGGGNRGSHNGKPCVGVVCRPT